MIAFYQSTTSKRSAAHTSSTVASKNGSGAPGCRSWIGG